MLAPASAPDAAAVRRWTGLAFLYWFGLVCALEPGNLRGGLPSDWTSEIVRLLGAGVLGSASAPALLVLARRGRWIEQALGVVLLAPALVVVSCLLAAWLLQGRWLPTPADVVSQLSANLALLAFGLAVFLGIVHLAQTRAQTRAQARTPAASPVRRLVERERGRITVIDLDQVRWIESQGNYQALRTPDGLRLVRRTLASLERELDPGRFVRIHRRTLVAVAHVEALSPLTNGDAEVRMSDGARLRLSRNHRRALVDRLDACVERPLT